ICCCCSSDPQKLHRKFPRSYGSNVNEKGFIVPDLGMLLRASASSTTTSFRLASRAATPAGCCRSEHTLRYIDRSEVETKLGN
ncbi:hypothetical protein GUJ93_ZPchr0305g33729, partial [Zizania palustris]